MIILNEFFQKAEKRVKQLKINIKHEQDPHKYSEMCTECATIEEMLVGIKEAHAEVYAVECEWDLGQRNQVFISKDHAVSWVKTRLAEHDDIDEFIELGLVNFIKLTVGVN